MIISLRFAAKKSALACASLNWTWARILAFQIARHLMLNVEPKNSRIEDEKRADDRELDERHGNQNVGVDVHDFHRDDRRHDQNVREQKTNHHRAEIKSRFRIKVIIAVRAVIVHREEALEDPAFVARRTSRKEDRAEFDSCFFTRPFIVFHT